MAVHSGIRVGDLFCGAGLFSAAFESQGAESVFAYDLDPYAIRSFCHNLRGRASVREINAATDTTSVDVLIAGPPCQGFSTLGRRDPKDARNGLCLHIPRWAKDTDAKVVVVENVPPFLQSPFWGKMAARLKRLGFELTTWELDAADFGTPQTRRRAFTIASKIGLPPIPKPLRQKATAGAIFAKAIPANDPMHIWPDASALAKARFALVPARGDKRDILRQRPDICPPSWKRMGANATDVWGRMDPTSPSNTLRCDFQNPSKGRYLHPSEDRVLSLREGARLQGVPDHWTFFGHRTAITRQIGNGVPLPLGRQVAKHVLALFH